MQACSPAGKVRHKASGTPGCIYRRLQTRLRCGQRVYSGRLYVNISLRLPDYCSVFQAEVMTIYRATQWILINGVPFTRILIFSDSQAAIKSLSNVANNSRIVRECRRCLNFLSGRFSVTLSWVPGHCDIPGNCSADGQARAGALLPEFSSIDLGMPLTSFKLAFARKCSRDANLSWINEESCSTAMLTWSQWIEGAPTIYLDLVVTSSRSQWP